MKNKTGKYLIIIGFVLSVLSPFHILVIGVPPYLVGCMVLLKSDENENSKALWILSPVFLWLPVMSILYYYFD